MATLHLMVGLPCSGKTTYARKLAVEENALLLTPDEWQRKILGLTIYDPESNHDLIHDNIEKIMWEVASRVLTIGVSVILDFGFWTRAERDYFRNKAKELKVDFKLHYMNVPKEDLIRRLEQRNISDCAFFIIDPKYIEKWCLTFEAPTEEELAE
jgi:predicted kinase